MNRMILLSFYEIFGSDEFKDKFNIHRFERSRALEWIRTGSIPSSRRLVERLSMKAQHRTKKLNTNPGFADEVLNELKTCQVSQLFRAALALQTYSTNDARIHQAFLYTFKEHCTPVKLINAGTFLQTVLGKTKNSHCTPHDS